MLFLYDLVVYGSWNYFNWIFKIFGSIYTIIYGVDLI